MSDDLIELLRLPRRNDSKTEVEVLVSLRPGQDRRPMLDIRERLRTVGGGEIGAWTYSKRAGTVFPEEFDALIECVVRAQEAVDAAAQPEAEA